MLWDTLPPLDQPALDAAPAVETPVITQPRPDSLAGLAAAPDLPVEVEAAHQALYRKWRSRSFEDVIGQDHVTRTLRNAVASGTVGHAYLFTGARGTGKTSTARVLARAVNCLNPRDGNPCNQCHICRGMEERRSMDLIEIDAASNNSVDDVRDLREKVGYAPSAARRKVYVIDEVHMLSTSAFNALLKTLEEPPRHVLFVLATTEAHRVPATVASRCQRFDFRPITPADTAARLAYVAAQEGIAAEPAALETLARYATGSLRDALGLLDQVRAFSGPMIGVAQVQEALGIADPRTLQDLAGYLMAADLAGALRLVDELGAKGADLRQFGRQIAGQWRDLLGARARNAWPADLGASPPSPAAIVGVIKAFLHVDAGAKRSNAAQLYLELALVEAVASLSSNGASITAAAAPLAGDPARPATSPSAPRPVASVPRQEPPRERVVPNPAPAEPERAARRPPAGSPVAPEPEPAAATTDVLSIDGVRAIWPRVLQSIRSSNMSLYAMLNSDPKPVDAGPDYVVLGFSPAYRLLKEKIEDPTKRAVIEEALAKYLGHACALRCVIIGKQDALLRPAALPSSATPPVIVPAAPVEEGATGATTIRDSVPNLVTAVVETGRPSPDAAPAMVPPAPDDHFIDLAARAFRDVHNHQEQQDLPPLDVEAPD